VGSALAPILVPDSREVDMGRGIVAQLESAEDFRLLGDAEVDAYINEIAQRVLAASPVQRAFPFTFKVCVNDQINAFALPGGFCYVQTGLITAAENEAQLVGVIAHEVSHVTCGHHREQLANEALIQTAQGMVFDESSPVVATAAARVASGLGMLTYSRSQESEADRVGAEAMARAGWNPRGLRDFFAALEAAGGAGGGRLSQMLSTHPANPARVAQLDQMIAAMGNVDQLALDSPRFHQIQERVNQLTR
jgi:predicted Zn-dependent protease